jgi:hypothetical protein
MFARIPELTSAGGHDRTSSWARCLGATARAGLGASCGLAYITQGLYFWERGYSGDVSGTRRNTQAKYANELQTRYPGDMACASAERIKKQRHCKENDQ